MTNADNIIAAKRAAGPDAFLWLHDSGDCILWPSEAESVDDDGRNAIDRWTVSDEVSQVLIESGEVDE